MLDFIATLGLGGIIGAVVTFYLERKKFIFQNIHQERVKILLELYRKIVRTERAFQSLMNPFQGAVEPPEEQKKKKAAETANDFLEYFHDNKIYLDDYVEEKIIFINEKLINTWARFNYTVKFDGKTDVKEWKSVWDEVKEEIPKISEEVKREFQKTIGIENN